MKNQIKFIQLLSLSLLLTLIPASLNQIANANGCAKYKIGYQGGLTGGSNTNAIGQLKAVKLAVSDFLNKNISAQNIIDASVVEIDDQASESAATTAVSQAVTNPCLLGVVGPRTSSAARNVLKIYKESGMPVITPSAGALDLGQYAQGEFNRLIAKNWDVYSQLANDLFASNPNSKILYLFTNYAEANGTFVDIKPRGLKVINHAIEGLAFEEIVEKIQSAKNLGVSTVIFDTGTLWEIGDLIASAKQPGSEMSVIFGPTIPLSEIEKNLANPHFQGAQSYYATPRFKDLGFTTPEANDELWAPNAYDAAYFMLSGMSLGNTTRADLRTFIRTNSMNGLTGPIDFDNFGELMPRTSPTFVVNSGKIEVFNAAESKVKGDFTISTEGNRTPNFTFITSDHQGFSSLGQVFVRTPQSHSVYVTDGTPLSIWLPNGTTVVEVFPGVSPAQFRGQIYDVTVSNGQVSSVINRSTNPNSSVSQTSYKDIQLYSLRTRAPNTSITLNTELIFDSAEIIVTSADFDVNYSFWSLEKKIDIYLDPSEIYRLQIKFNDDSIGLASESIISDIQLTGSSPFQIVVNPRQANVLASVLSLQHTTARATLSVKNGDSFEVAGSRTPNYKGEVGFYVNPGSTVKVRFAASEAGLTEVETGEFLVPASGVLTIPSVFYPETNVKGKISLSDDSPMMGANLEFVNSAKNMKYYSSTNSLGEFAVKLVPDTYEIRAFSLNDVDHNSPIYQCVVAPNAMNTCDTKATIRKVSGIISGFSNQPAEAVSLTANLVDNQVKYPYRRHIPISPTGKFGLEIEASKQIFSVHGTKSDAGVNGGDTFQYDRGYSGVCEIGNTPKICNFSLLKNFKYRILDASGRSLLKDSIAAFFMNTDVRFSQEFAKIKWYQGARFQLLDTESFSLPDGQHLVRISKGFNVQLGKYNNNSEFHVIVENGAISQVKNLGDNSIISAVGGVFDLRLPQPNFLGKVDEGVMDLPAEVYVTNIADGQNTYVFPDSGTKEFELNLPTGSYDLVLRTTQPTANRTDGRYVVTVADSGQTQVVQRATSATVTKQDGKFPIKYGLPNLLGTVSQQGSGKEVSINWFKYAADRQYWLWDSQSQTSAEGRFFKNFLPGTYRAQIYLSDPNTGRSKMILAPECVVPQSGSVTCDVQIPNNPVVTTISSGGNVVKNAYASISVVGGDGKPNFETCCLVPDEDTGKFDLLLFDGTYRLTFVEKDEGSFSSRTYLIEVKNSIITSFKESAQGTVISPTGGIYELAFLPSNLAGTIKNSSGSAVDLSSKGATLEVQKWQNESYWGGVKNAWLNNSAYEIRVDDPGKYRIQIIPSDTDNFTSSFSQEFFINGEGKVSLTENGTYTNSLTNLDVSLKSNNVKFKVVSPVDQQPLARSVLYFYKIVDNVQQYVRDIYIWEQQAGLGGTALEEGVYQLSVLAPNQSQFYTRQYEIEVAADLSVIVRDGNQILTPSGGRFNVSPHRANVTGRLLDLNGNPVGQGPNKNVSINVQKFSEELNEWGFIGGSTNADRDGFFGTRITGLGKYRLVIEPYGFSTAAQTYSAEFTIDEANQSAFTKEFGSISLNAPNVKIQVLASDNGAPLTDLWIGIYRLTDDLKKGKSYIRGMSPDANGLIGGFISEEGRYEFEVYPPSNNGVEGATRKSYLATAARAQNGTISVSFDAVTGVALVDGVTRLRLGGSNLRGTVFSTDGTTPIANSQVLPYQVDANGESPRWDLAAWTNSLGKWAINLPAGNFKIKALAPYDSNSLASSLRSGVFAVNEAGAVTPPAGKTALSFAINLRSPTWSGVLMAPTGNEVMEYASICINYRIGANAFSGECVRTDKLGRFGVSIPDDGTLDEDTYIRFDSGGKYPSLELRGKAAIEAKLGASGSGLTVRLPAPNILVTVQGRNPNNEIVAQPNVWVSIDRPGVGWVGGQVTNAQGVAGMYASNITDAFRINLNAQQSTSAATQLFVSTIKDFSAPDILSATSGGIFQTTINLPSPNIRGIIRNPAVGAVPSTVAENAYFHVYDVDRGEWLQGGGVSKDGTFALFLKGGCCESRNYRLTVEPGWSGDGKRSQFVRKEYEVSVSTTDLVTIKDSATDTVVGTETIQGVEVKTLNLANPNLVGTVVNPAGNPVSDSFISAWGPCRDWSGCYQWSDGEGKFSLNLANGEYNIGAQAPWWNSTLVDSARCDITVASNTVSNRSNSTCVQNDGKVKLALRAPNLTFTLTDGTNPVENAHISISIGGWGTYGRSDSQGRVAMFVDTQAITRQTTSDFFGNQTTFTPRIWVWVGSTNSEVVSWSCSAKESKPICNLLQDYTLGTDWTSQALGTVVGVRLNTRIKVVSPDAQKRVRGYAYAEIARIDGNQTEKFGWSETNNEGYARFSLEGADLPDTARFQVRVWPPYEYRSVFVAKTHNNGGSGYTLAQLNNLELELGTPNLKLAIVAPNGSTPNRYGWFMLEEVLNTNPITYDWQSANGLDYAGAAAANLDPSKKYRLTVYPGGGRSGSTTRCVINTDAQTVITLESGQCAGGTLANGTLTLKLARGNVTGVVYAPDGTTPIVGAIVYASATYNKVVNGNDVPVTLEVTTCTLNDGSYGFTLDSGYSWVIKVFPANAATGPQYASKTVSPEVQVVGDASTTIDVTLSLKS